MNQNAPFHARSFNNQQLVKGKQTAVTTRTQGGEMECSCLHGSFLPILPFHKTVISPNCHNFPSNSTTRRRFPSKFTVNCTERTGENASTPPSTSSAYAILGVEPSCSAAELKAAFRAKVQFFFSF